jgi:acetyltransferase-like isoleucine patch superfamily enzyme
MVQTTSPPVWMSHEDASVARQGGVVIEATGTGNVIKLGRGVIAEGSVRGDGNEIEVGDTPYESRLDIRVNGSRNKIVIGPESVCRGLLIMVGSHVAANDVSVVVGRFFTTERYNQFLLPNSGNHLTIGDECMFSNGIVVRCGESPHLIFDQVSGDYLDISSGVYIGHHVWVGERAYLTKHAGLPDETIVAACAVVTKPFGETHTALGGNPARVIRKGVVWVRNASHLKDGPMKDSYRRHQSR